MENTTVNNTATPTPAEQPAPVAAPVSAPTTAAPVTTAQATQPAQADAPATQPAAPAPAPAAQPAPTATTAQTEEIIWEETKEETEENEEETKAPKLILNTQRILDDWKHEKGKVLIFFMYLLEIFSVLSSIGLFTWGFIFLIAEKATAEFWAPIKEIPNIEKIAPILLISAICVAIWWAFAHKLTPYFKAFSIAKWLEKNEINPAEIMKIFLQSRDLKKLTKYGRSKGGVKAEQADLAQGAFILLNEKHKSIYKQEFVWTLLFWLFISAAEVFFILFLSQLVGDLSAYVVDIVKKNTETKFTFMGLLELLLHIPFLATTGGWIVLGIAQGIVRAAIPHARNKEQQKWVNAYMKDDLPSKEYY